MSIFLRLILHECLSTQCGFLGFNLGKLYKDIEHLQLKFRSPNQFPDAILFWDDTEEAMNIEFETLSKNFEEHRHEAEKCDLIVCFLHNEDWKNPLPVYELTSGKMYPAS